METLEFVKNAIIKQSNATAARKGYTIDRFDFDSCERVYITFKNNKLHFDFSEGGYYFFTSSNGKEVKRTLSIIFTCAYKTKSGYISTKKLPVKVQNVNDVTLEEATELLKFLTDAKENTYDPFYYENKARRASNSAWNQIASKLTDSTWG